MSDARAEAAGSSSTARPLVSVVVPTFNCAAYLGNAIESVLRQTYPRLEVIVVDDGSTDGTGLIIEAFGERVRHVRQQHEGAGAARNHGVHEAHGELLAFLDADDLWVEDKLSRQVVRLSAAPAVDIVFGLVEEFHSEDLSESERQSVRRREGRFPGYMAQTMLIRRDTFWRVGEFGTTWRVGEFIDWYLKGVELGLRGAMLPELVARRRLHRNNMGIRERGARADYARILKGALDRRRAVTAGPVAAQEGDRQR